MSGGLWTAIFAGGLGAVYAAVAFGRSGDLSLAVVTVAAGALLLVMERAWPQEAAWLEGDGQWWHDLGHLIFGFALGTFGGTWAAQWLFAGAAFAVWPESWPLIAQVAVGLIVAEFFVYWQHRAVHSVPALWHLHALHHSTARMTFFKTTRIHALDIGTATFLWTASLLVLGAPVSVVLWVTAFGNFSAQTQHANVRLRTPPWLNAIVCTPAVHWLHHSIDKREGHSNFGMNVMLWDHVFGTFIRPGAQPRQTLGIEPNHVPASFLGQLALPWLTVRALFRRT
jgi:sterol desaturase/sphingolipid hydroxylase (fatty acid hydroxylase superfamily)